MTVTTVSRKKKNNNHRRSLPAPSSTLPDLKDRRIDYEKIVRAHGVLRSKRLMPLKIQHTQRDQWE
jgi:hypothetical protein